MRPYLAIVKDSFREALASRVLWVLLFLITAVLVALTPFHLRGSVAAKLRVGDIRNLRNLANSLATGKESGGSALHKYLWHSLSDSTRKRLDQLDSSRGPEAFRAREELVADFNQLIEGEDFYQAELWQASKLDRRAEELLKQSNLDDAPRQQFNRLALEAALPGQLRSCPDEAVVFRYAKWDLDFVPPIGRKFAIETLNTFVLAFMAIFVGFFGIFAGVLVTAPIIPNMFDSGSLYVLLSKPIARPLLFITKFVGGCSFVVINASYLILGVWLILGFRFGVWKPQILWSIPIFVFSFAIFYSVSAISGLFWRSTVMAIVATVVFWFACTAVGSTKSILEQLVIVPRRIDRLLQHGDQLFAVRKNGNLSRWDADSASMEAIFARADDQAGPPMMLRRNPIRGIIYDPHNKELVALERQWSRANIVVGRHADDWVRKVASPAPKGSAALFWHADGPIAVADEGVYRISSKSPDESRLPDINIFGLKIPTPAPQQLHINVSEGLTGGLPADAQFCFEPAKQNIYVYGAGKLRRWHSAADELFREAQQIDLEIGDVSALAAGGDVLVAASPGEFLRLHLFDGTTLEALSARDTSNAAELRKLAMSPDGRWIACLFENDHLELIDIRDDRTITRLPAQGSLTEMLFDESNLVICDSNDRILSLSLPDLSLESTISPKQSFIQKIYRYLVKPLHFVFPKPAELQDTMRYAITGKDTVKLEGPAAGPDAASVKLDPWQPLVSNSAFIAVMLLIGSVYMYRQDF